MGEADEDHLGGHHRPVGLLHLGNALEQHLPGAGEDTDREALGEIAAAHALGLGEAVILHRLGHELEAGDEMGEFGEVVQHHDRIGAGIVLRPQFPKRRGDVALHHGFEEVDDAGPVGQA